MSKLLWDNEPFYQDQRRRCFAAAKLWRPQHLAERYNAFFRQIIQTVSAVHPLIRNSRP